MQSHSTPAENIALIVNNTKFKNTISMRDKLSDLVFLANVGKWLVFGVDLYFSIYYTYYAVDTIITNKASENIANLICGGGGVFGLSGMTCALFYHANKKQKELAEIDEEIKQTIAPNVYIQQI